MTDQVTLKPCPCCEAIAEYATSTGYGHGYTYGLHYVRCTVCGMRTPEFSDDYQIEDVRPKAAAIWNKRP